MKFRHRTLIPVLALAAGCGGQETGLRALTSRQAKTDKPIVAQCLGAHDPQTTGVMTEGAIQIYTGDILLDMDGARMPGRNSICRIAAEKEMEVVCVAGSKTMVTLDPTKQFTLSAGGWPVTFVDETPTPGGKAAKKDVKKVTVSTPPESTYCLFRIKAETKPKAAAAKPK